MTNLYDMPAEIEVTAEGAIRVITLNRPADLNASSTEMLLAFPRLFAGLAAVIFSISSKRWTTATSPAPSRKTRAVPFTASSTYPFRSLRPSTAPPSVGGRPSPPYATSC